MALPSGCLPVIPNCARLEPSKSGSRRPKLSKGRCFAGCGVCRRRVSRRVPDGNR